MQNNNQKYNRLELILLSNIDYDYMEFQPYAKRGLYTLGMTNFILYGVQPTEAEKMELIRRIVTNQIKMQKPYEDQKGYFGDEGFGGYMSYDEIVIFSFLFVAKGMEHLAIPFTQFEDCDGVEEFGYLDDGTILNAKETKGRIAKLKKEQYIRLLKEISTLSYSPVNNIADIFRSLSIDSFTEKHFGKPKTIEEVRIKFKELSKMHHPDVGGDELMFKAISNGKTYLIDKINYNSRLIAS